MSQTYVYTGHQSPTAAPAAAKHPRRLSSTIHRAHDVALQKRQDRERLLASHSAWRLPYAVPQPERDVDGRFTDVSALPLVGLTPAERDIVQSDATALVARLAQGALTAVEVTTAFCKAAVVACDVTNCLTEIFIDEGLRRARELDEHFQRTGTVVGPLHGLPVSIKDHILVKGHDTATGYVAWAYKNVAEKDACVADILRKAGAVLYVKTANPQTLLSLETNNNIYGRTYNPFNRKLTPGGSSGGEAALIACGGSPLGVGTDIGGSIRAPAAWSGIYGLKGSVGRLPHTGLLGSHDGMDNIIGCVGPMARSARDLALFCRVMSQADPWLLEHQVLEMPWRQDVVVPDKLCFAILWDDGVVSPHPPIIAALHRTKDALLAAGHEVIDWTPLDHQASWDLMVQMYLLDAGEEYCATLREGDDAPVQQTEWMLGFARGRKPLTVPETWRVNMQREAFRAKVLQHWNATRARTSTGRPADAILSAVAPTLAPPHDTVRWWGYSSYWNLVDYPAAVFPIGKFDAQAHHAAKRAPPMASGASSAARMFPIGCFSSAADSGAEPSSSGLEDSVPGDGSSAAFKPRNELEASVHAQWDPATYDNAPISLQLVGRRLNEEKLLKMLEVVEGALGECCGTLT